MPHPLHLSLPDGLHAELAARAAAEGSSVAHLVRSLLADAVAVEHHSLFQVSTSGALVEGVYQGCVSVADLRRHGDFGLGTFEGLDGELVMLDGRCYQARGEGQVGEAPDDALTPFAVVTRFAPDQHATVGPVAALADLEARIDALRSTDNVFVGIRAHGRFGRVSLRAACRSDPGVPLVDATRRQNEWEARDVTGTLVGFWSPGYVRSVAIAGHHLHLISDDHEQAGHVLDLAADELALDLHVIDDVHLALPETEAFVRADLSRDPGRDLDVAEHRR